MKQKVKEMTEQAKSSKKGFNGSLGSTQLKSVSQKKLKRYGQNISKGQMRLRRFC